MKSPPLAQKLKSQSPLIGPVSSNALVTMLSEVPSTVAITAWFSGPELMMPLLPPLPVWPIVIVQLSRVPVSPPPESPTHSFHVPGAVWPMKPAKFDGGTATGDSLVRVTNTVGGGALTTGNGILIVDAINGATTTPGAFALESFVIAGPYEYTLYRGSSDASAPDSWFLRNNLEPTPTPPPTPPPTPTPTPTPPPTPPPVPPTPHYREETSLYSAAPAWMGIYGRQIVGTLHERVGDEEQLRGGPGLGESNMLNGVWGRIILRHGESDGDPLGIYGNSRQGPSYESDLVAFQIGADIYREEKKREDGTTGTRNHAGLMGTYGSLDGEVDHNLLERRFHAGTIDMEAWSVGGFFTHYQPNGAYIDAVAQFTWYDTKIRSLRLPIAKTDGFGIALSAEGGYPLQLAEDWQLEPQAQLIYQSLSMDGFKDLGATVRFRDLDSLVGRVGFRLSLSNQTICQVRYSNGTPLPLRRALSTKATKTRSSRKSEICSTSGWTPSSVACHISSIHSRTRARPWYISPIPARPSRASQWTSGWSRSSRPSTRSGRAGATTCSEDGRAAGREGQLRSVGCSTPM